MKKVSTRIGTITASDEVLDWLSVLLEDAVRYNENKGLSDVAEIARSVSDALSDAVFEEIEEVDNHDN